MIHSYIIYVTARCKILQAGILEKRGLKEKE